MENFIEWLLGLDMMILIIVIFGGFVAWELKSGEIPLRWLRSIRRDTRPFFYWIGILFHLVILVIVIYAYMDGFRLPLADFFK